MFSFNRFYEQLKIVLFHGARMHGTLLLIFLLYFLLSHFSLFNHMTLTVKDPYASFEFFTVLAAVLSSLEVFGRLRSVHSGINYLMVPATAFEKYLAALLYSTIGIFFTYMVSFGVVHTLVIGGHNLTSPDKFSYAFPSGFELWDVFKTLMFVQSIYFLGSLVFKKSPLAKTTLVVISCILTFSFIMSWLFFHQTGFQFDVAHMNQMAPARTAVVFPIIQDILHAGSWVLPFACWIAAYFRLQSTQI